MFHVELVPLEGIFGPLKSDLGVFWPFRATDFIMGILKIWDNFWGFQLPILRLTFLEFSRNLWQFGINKKDGCFFFRLRVPSGPMWSVVICCAEKNKSTNCIPYRNMLSQHSSSSMTFLSLRSGPLWNFTRMGDNVKSKLVRRSQTFIFYLTHHLEGNHLQSSGTYNHW